MTATKAEIIAPRGRRQSVQAATTGMVVLNGLARLGGRASLTLLAKHVAENPAKVHRYLISMMEEGLVAQDPVSLQYYLGSGAIQIGLAAMRQADPIRVSEAALLRLRESLEMTCFIAVMGNKGPTIVRFEEPGLPVTLNVRVGSVLSLLWSATGRVFLSYLDDARIEKLAQKELEHMLQAKREALGDPNLVDALKQSVRAAGMAVVKDTNLAGISAIAVPIFDFSDKVCAVLTVLGATGSFEASADSSVAQTLRREGVAISEALGHLG